MGRRKSEVVCSVDRRVMARLMRCLASGVMKVDDFERAARKLSVRDGAIVSAVTFAWYFNDDFRTVRLRGKWSLTKEARRYWARWVLYLSTDDELYPNKELSVLTGYAEPFRRLAHAVRNGVRRMQGKEAIPLDDPEGLESPVWPFADEEHLKRAERRYLASLGWAE